MAESSRSFRLIAAIAGIFLALPALLLGSSAAHAATTIDGPVDLGTAQTFGVLGGSAVTNTGPTVITGNIAIPTGDVGVSPGTSISGFPPGNFTGVTHSANAVALQAQTDLNTAFNAAASLTPMTSGLANLTGLSLTPGVYAGGALRLDSNGTLTLAGSANSVWVFQAASTLIVGSASHIVVSGGASACNVFWQIGSSATLGTTADFVGTVMADQSITATTGATITGRLLAKNAAVTLDSNVITLPTGCSAPGTVGEDDTPAFTSGLPMDAVVGTPYEFDVTATGAPTPDYDVTSGTLPTGLSLDTDTGAISGTPTEAGTWTFTITATNGPPIAAVSQILPLAVAPAAAPVLAATGTDVGGAMGLIALLLFGGLLLLHRAALPRCAPAR
ncbi:MAG: ice-binding family protein [Rhodoglobus sp.]